MLWPPCCGHHDLYLPLPIKTPWVNQRSFTDSCAKYHIFHPLLSSKRSDFSSNFPLKLVKFSYISSIISRILCGRSVISMLMISILLSFLFNCRREREIEELMQLPPGQRRSRRNSYLSLLIGFSYVFCVAPFSICWFLPKSYPFTGFLLTLNHVVNPIVYFVKYFVDGRRRNRTIMEQKSCVPTATTTST